MKKIALLLIIVITMISCSDKNKNIDEKPTDNEVLKVDAVKNSQGDLVGVANRKSFTSDDSYKDWFNNGYKSYSLKTEAVTKIKNNSTKITIKAFMGTWCPDSRREVPRLYKILDQASFDEKKLTMITVDRNKTANGLEKTVENGISKVATFVFFRQKIEIGRFIEKTSGNKTLEEMIAEILEK